MADNLNRVFLWCVPRTVSTAFLKCISFADGLQVVNEPYNCAFYFGPERKNPEPDLNNPLDKRLVDVCNYESLSDEMVRGFDEKTCTYGWIRDDLLGASYEDKKVLFCKDMAHYLDGKYHMLPRGFRHSFLIRHPVKVFPSWKKLLVNLMGESCAKHMENLRELPKHVFPVGCGFKELHDLMEYVEKSLDPEPVVIDADDLLADPPGILSAYCHEMGIPYSPKLLSWDGNANEETWKVSRTLLYANRISGFFDKALQSTEFSRPTPLPPANSLPIDIQACVEASMGYYEKLHERRIKPLPSS